MERIRGEVGRQGFKYKPREREGDLTPEWMAEHGFVFRRCGISGCDSWQGMDFWMNDRQGTQFTLRGYVSTAYGGWLCPAGYINAQWHTQEEVKQGFKLLTGEELKTVDRVS